jgi:3-oxoacyl-[acyl-carrier protein] reductase
MIRSSTASSNDEVGKPLLGKSGIVTGAGTGIGKAIAIRLAELGADIGINYFMSEDGARKTQAEIIKMERQGKLLQCDVSKENQVKSMVKKALDEFGRIDFLVNNATGSHTKSDNSIEDAIIDDWYQEIGVDLTGAFLCSHHVAPIMLGSKSGRIVNISSICGITGDCGPAYCSAKAGLLGLTRSCAVGLAPYVQVNAILPGFVSSQSHDATLVSRITPGKKMGTPNDVAELVGNLVSMKGTFLTGSCIVMDGSVTEGVIGLSMGWVSQKPKFFVPKIIYKEIFFSLMSLTLGKRLFSLHHLSYCFNDIGVRKSSDVPIVFRV